MKGRSGSGPERSPTLDIWASQELKTCPKCGAAKPPTAFSIRQGPCKECFRLYSKRRRRLPHVIALDRIVHRRQNGIELSESEWQARFNSQGRRCAICGKDQPGLGGGRSWATDHDHETGRVRGILCHRCNRNLVAAAEDPLMPAVLAYLARAASEEPSEESEESGRPLNAHATRT